MAAVLGATAAVAAPHDGDCCPVNDLFVLVRHPRGLQQAGRVQPARSVVQGQPHQRHTVALRLDLDQQVPPVRAAPLMQGAAPRGGAVRGERPRPDAQRPALTHMSPPRLLTGAGTSYGAGRGGAPRPSGRRPRRLLHDRDPVGLRRSQRLVRRRVGRQVRGEGVQVGGADVLVFGVLEGGEAVAAATRNSFMATR